MRREGACRRSHPACGIPSWPPSRPGPQPAPSSLVTLPFIFLNSIHCFEFDFCFLVCGQPPPPPHGGHRGHRPDRDVCRLRPVRREQADTRSARRRVCQPRQRPAGSERGLRLGGDQFLRRQRRSCARTGSRAAGPAPGRPRTSTQAPGLQAEAGQAGSPRVPRHSSVPAAPGSRAHGSVAGS